jgi:6,7-dimethyl-8-ribityllumazine synthase
MAIETLHPELAGADLRIGVVQSRFNEPVCLALRDACLSELLALGVLEEDILVATVPGALEIPLALEKMAEAGQFDALIALGAVIRGETYHFELVSNESASGISSVALRFGIPVANGVLTTETDAQAEVRSRDKGRDAARVAVEMANLASRLEDLAFDGDDTRDDMTDDAS